MNTAISLRPVRPEDIEFLQQLYASNRAQEMALIPWNDAQKTQFLDMQFRAQQQQYQRRFADDCFRIVVLGGKPIGRFYVAHQETQYHVIDISLLPQYQGCGIGGDLLGGLCARAAAASKPVTLQVAHGNRARHLYERLGFKMTGDDDVYIQMAWTPPAGPHRVY